MWAQDKANLLCKVRAEDIILTGRYCHVSVLIFTIIHNGICYETNLKYYQIINNQNPFYTLSTCCIIDSINSRIMHLINQ